MARRLDEGLILKDGLTLDPGPRGYLMSGRIDCAEGMAIDVRKVLRILSGEGPTAMVQTVDYAYHVLLADLGNVFRYCSPHDDGDHPGHKPFHHKHVYDVLIGDVVGTVEATGDDEWPTLGEVIEEARDWYSAYAERIEMIRSR